MQAVIQHESGVIFSIKTFRPLFVFPWYSSMWRQLPMRTCLATVRYDNKSAAEAGHKELAALLNNLKIDPEMRKPFAALEAFGKEQQGHGVKSYRIYPGREVEDKIRIDVSPKRDI